MIGVVLCGGKSSRMGSDKGLLKSDDRTWAQVAADKLSRLGFPIKISINQQQLNQYAEVFPLASLVVDDPALSIGGPLSGVINTHLAFPHDDLFVLACDMLLMETFILEELHQHFEQHPGADVYVYSNDGEPEPLCGIYTASCLSAVTSLIRLGQPAKHSMKSVLDRYTVYGIALEDDRRTYFKNFNAHAELNGL
jgi:molybdopterin-guanine dinucleotide biosynthesis protein A